MPTSFPPLVIPPKRHLVSPMRRPFNADIDCVLCLLPDINTTWLDYSDESNNGTIGGATLVNTGRRGQALSFDGVNDMITITHSASLADFTALTIEGWFFPLNIGGDGGLRTTFRKGGTAIGGHVMYTSNLTAGKLVWATVNHLNAEKSAFNTGFTPANAWHHVVAVYNGATMVLYVDAVPGDATAQTGTLNNVSDLTISHNSNDYQGLIDEVRYYRRALEAWEVTALYEAGKP